jgi:hypothetical protein
MAINNKEQKALDTITYLKNGLDLKSKGSVDTEGYQIFTPDFVVKKMIDLIDSNVINSFEKTILEPTSGDGAFVVEILKKRFCSIENKSDFLLLSLKALSTIFSIELDTDLMNQQRNNIYTIVIDSINKRNIKINTTYEISLKRIILNNFINGELNIDHNLKFADDPIGWYVVDNKTVKKQHNRIKFARWKFDKSLSATFELEDWEQNSNSDSKYFGGIFSENQ